MADNREQWDALREAEDRRTRRKSVWELDSEGYEYYKQADYRRAIERFREAAELAEEQGDVDNRCKNLYWEGYCWQYLGRPRAALERLLRAESLGGGDAGVRLYTLSTLFEVANRLPLPRAEQEKLLGKLAPYKGSGRIGDSQSMVLNDEMLLPLVRGDRQCALDRAQEAFACRVDEYPGCDDVDYYLALVACYRENGRLAEAWETLRDWRSSGSTEFAYTKSWQFRAEAQLLYAEGKLGTAWDAIRRCQAEEQYLRIHGTTRETETLTWLIRIAADSGRLREARTSLPPLFRFHNAESLYDRYDCFYWFAYYYAALWRYLREGGEGASRFETEAIARARAERWYKCAEGAGRELDELLETDVKKKELDELRAKLVLEDSHGG